MNSCLLGAMLLTAFISSCTTVAKEKERVEGIYVGQFEGEFSKGADTILIEAYNEGAGAFTITHKKGYQRIIDGKIGKKEYKMDKSVGIWDSEHRQIREQKHGRVYTFPASGNELLLGVARYQRVE